MVRQTNGQFAKGVSGNPKGRPKKEREVVYYRILEMAVSEDDWSEICKRAVYDARRGDSVARKWLADYLIGPPVERKEISGTDGSPLIIKVVYDEK